MNQNYILHPKLKDLLTSVLKSDKTPVWVKRFFGIKICDDETAIRINNHIMLVFCGVGVVTGIMGTLISVLALSTSLEQFQSMKTSDRITIITAPFIFLLLGWFSGRYVFRFWRLVRNPESREGNTQRH
jgi:hypothetical protein